VKFGDLLVLAKELGADALATGHYVRRIAGLNGPDCTARQTKRAIRAISCSRPRPAQLEMVRFSIGRHAKDKVREIAHELGLPVAEKPDSQDICFVPQGRYGDVVARLRPDASEPGRSSMCLGACWARTRESSIHRRSAQRLGSFRKRGAAVRAQDRCGLAPRRGGSTRFAPYTDYNAWRSQLAGDCATQDVSCLVKVRSTRAPTKARVTPQAGGRATVELIDGEDAVAPAKPASSTRKRHPGARRRLDHPRRTGRGEELGRKNSIHCAHRGLKGRSA